MTNGVLAGVGVDEAALNHILDEHASVVAPRLERMWAYYRNPTMRGSGVGGMGGVGGAGRARVLGQEMGLPSRITGRPPCHPQPHPALAEAPVGPAVVGPGGGTGVRREVVIENDIAWRVQSMVDFMFGKPVRIASTAADEGLRAAVERVLDAAWEASGGIALLQDAALLGHVFGWVDFLVDVDAQGLRDLARSVSGLGLAERAARAAAGIGPCVRIEVLDPRRGVPICDPADYRRLLAYVVRYEREGNRVEAPGWWERAAGREGPRRVRTLSTRVMTAGAWRQFEGERVVGRGETPWTAGRVPVAHVQNIAEPWSWAGLGEVEPLMGLQDELNTRLSDRANRVTMQSFKMYVAKGIEGFDQVPVAPGQVWTTDNPEASVQAFGGDAASPSEDEHIRQVREAMDKVSGIPPVAGGVVQGRIGNLSSANALRVTLMSVLAKTARKRVTYGRGMAEVCSLVLGALDWAGVLETPAAERGVRMEWPDPLPVDDRERVLAAEGKTRLGVPQERVLSELGYGGGEPGVG